MSHPPKRRKVKTPAELESYRRKRDFAKSPEPAAGAARAARGKAREPEPIFVVHRHEARQLHYDLRLEMEGVLKSFAVPKGFSWTPEDKHLAVQTEDHPIEYEDFDGVIPKGLYGAGTMTIWDRGTYRLTHGKDPVEELAAGELKLELKGGRLRGGWHMVRTRGERDWLLFKHKDRYAREKGDPELALDFSRVPPAGGPAALPPMTPGDTRTPFSAPGWLFELDFAGRRAIATVAGDDVRFAGASGRPLGVDLPAIAKDLRRLRAQTARVDGVLVALDERERPDPDTLARRLREGATGDLVYYVFDLLHYEDWSLADLPLLERKRALLSLLPRGLGNVLYVDHVTERGEELSAAVLQGGLPGVVAKRADSAYRPGPSPAWVKVPAPAAGGAPAARDAAARGKTVSQALAAGGGRRRAGKVKITNRAKVFWPAEGITKGRLLDYYERIADVLLPYLRDRPLHMLRYPDGIQGKAFYQKNVTGRVPDWVPTVELGEEGGEPVRYVVCNDRDTLLYLVNLASIDLHPWHSRVSAMDSPDWAILDLDPSADDFAKVVRIARTVGKTLRGAGLRPLLKTSGATGMHIYVPLARGYTYEQAKMFCEVVARMTVREHKDIATVERTPGKRGNKVYVDFGQNRREQTVVPPYVVRPVPGASVSCPLDWDELSVGMSPQDFTMDVVGERLAARGDLFRPLLADLQDLKPAIEALADL